MTKLRRFLEAKQSPFHPLEKICCICAVLFLLNPNLSAQNSVQFGTAEFSTNTLTIPLNLSNNTDFRFFSFSLEFDNEVLEIEESDITPNSNRLDPGASTQITVGNETGLVSVDVLNLLGDLAVPSGSGAIFDLTFTLKKNNICPDTLVLVDVEADDPDFNSVVFDLTTPKNLELSLSPSRGCITLERDTYGCNDTIRIVVEDQDLSSEKLLEFTFEDDNREMNTGTLGSDFDLDFSGADVVAEEGHDSDHSLFFDDSSDSAQITISLDFPGESGRLEFWYKPSADAVGRDNVLFSTRNEIADGVRHMLMIRDADGNGEGGPELVFREADNAQVLSGPITLEADGIWRHLEFVWAPGVCRLSVDGTIIAGSDECTFMRFTSISGLAIGGEIDGTGEDDFRGFIDDIRLYRTGAACVEVSVAGVDSDAESVCLLESSPGSATFEGAIPTSNTIDLELNDGVLSIDNEASVLIGYNDQEDGSGASGVVSDSVSIDCVPPVIMVPAEPIEYSIGSALPDFLDGVTANDNTSGDIRSRIVVDDSGFDPNVEGDYTITYSVVDEAGNISDVAQRTIRVKDDSLQLSIAPNETIRVPEGGSLDLTITLNKPPTNTIILKVIRSQGDGDISILGGDEFQFTETNWNTGETVTLTAAEDEDSDDGSADFLIRKILGTDKVFSRIVNAFEDDDERVISINRTGFGTTDPAGTVLIDEDDLPMSILATPGEGSTFVEWQGTNVDIADPEAASTTVTTTDNGSVIAVFTPPSSNAAPDVAITAPSNNTVLIAPANIDTDPLSIPIRVDASDPDGEVTKVEFLVNGEKIGEDATSPYEFQWDITTPDSYTLTALATDNADTKSISAPIAVVINDLSFEFTRPGTETPPVFRTEPFHFQWAISPDAEDFEFDLYLSRVSNVSADAIERSVQLSESRLNSQDHSTGYTQIDDFPFDPTSPETVWFPFIVVTSDPYQGQIHVSQTPLIIINREEVNVEVLRPRAGEAFELGQFVTLRSSIFSETGTALNGTVTVRLTDSAGSEMPSFPEFVREGLLELNLTGNDLPNSQGPWTVEVTWPGTSNYQGNSDDTEFMVNPIRAFLDVNNLDAVQTTGKPLKITGDFTLFNQNPGVLPLSNFDLKMTVEPPTGVQREIAITLNDDGHFVHEFDTGFFDSNGSWAITIECPDAVNFSECDSIERTLEVRDKRGYAILVLGSLEGDNPEGLSEHQNTLMFVQGQLQDSGVKEDDILWIRSNESDDPKLELKDAIENEFVARLNESPAPLYIVLVGHGNPDGFIMGDDIVTPEDLNGWITDLEAKIPDQPIVITAGMCYSGSFIPALSKPESKRVIITSAATPERSIRGLGEASGRQGEFFVFLLFREFGLGASLLRSFEISSRLIRIVSNGFDLTSDDVTILFRNELGQHPLLDDNGDGIGSTNFAEGVDDGDIARTLFLPNEIEQSRLEIKRTNPTRFLAHDDGLPELWVEIESTEVINNPVVRMEVKPSRVNNDDIEGSETMQAGLTLIKVDLERDESVTDAIRFQWPPTSEENDNPQDLFVSSGLHNAFFIAEADGFSQSEPAFVRVYRTPELAEAPTMFNLKTPKNGAVIDFADVDSAGFFTWEESACQERNGTCSIRYIFRLWRDPLANDDDSLVLESEPTVTPFIFFTASELDTGDFWWDVVAVTETGNVRVSEQRFAITILPTNGSNFGFVSGRILERRNDTDILEGSLTVGGTGEGSHIWKSGFYALTLEVADGYTLSAEAPGYKETTVGGIEIRPNQITELDIAMPVGMVLDEKWALVSTPVDMNEQINSENLDSPFWTWKDGTFKVATSLFPGKGYWINGREKEFFIETAGTLSESRKKPLKIGWNLIGIESLNPVKSLVTEMTLGPVWGWDKAKQTYTRIDLNSGDAELIPGLGYWVYVKK